MGITYTWQSGATNFGLASSWTPSGGPPTSSDDAEIDVAANVSGTGVAQDLDINAAVTVSSLLNTTVVNAAIIGNSAVGGVTVSSTWDANGYLQVGGADAGTLTIGSGGVVDQSVTSDPIWTSGKTPARWARSPSRAAARSTRKPTSSCSASMRVRRGLRP
jgi:T5SS/PEP-CTERM-associated repeat protein